MKREQERIHQKALRHVKKHRKKFARFVLFFIFLLLFRIIEDYFLLTSPVFEVEIDIFILTIVLVSAVIFTMISEVTEILIEEEEAKKIMKYIMGKERDIERKIKG